MCSLVTASIDTFPFRFMVGFAVFLFFVAIVLFVGKQWVAGVIFLFFVYCIGQALLCVRIRNSDESCWRMRTLPPMTATIAATSLAISSSSSAAAAAAAAATINPLSHQIPPGYVTRSISSREDHRNFEIRQAAIIIQQQQQLRQQMQLFAGIADQQRTNYQQQQRVPHPALFVEVQEEEEEDLDDPKSPDDV